MAGDKNGQNGEPAMMGLLQQVLSKVTAIETKVNDIDAKVGRLDERVGNLERAVAHLEISPTGLQEDQLQRRVNVMDRIGRLQTAVESLQEELRTEGHSAITAVTSVRNVRVEYDNLYDVVRSMQRQQNFLTDQVDEPRRRGEPKL